MVFESGNAVTLVLASCSVPLFAPPVVYEGKLLVDGGLAGNCPLRVLDQLEVDVAIGVDVSRSARSQMTLQRRPGLLRTLKRSWEMQRSHLLMNHSSKLNLLITPETWRFSFANFTPRCVDQLVDAGVEAAEEALPRLDALLSRDLTCRSSEEAQTQTPDAAVSAQCA